MTFLDKYRINRALRQVGNYDLDGVLGRFGLERRSIAADVAADVGFFVLGCLAGALAGVFFAPRRGIELREQMKKSIGERGFVGGMQETIRQTPAGRA
ncbi:MAG: YtxH domain-containing protein [Deltaproteobacteria bacterium]|nr:YtxH domain-containing protein [Deltaproteobacteria bacterium]